MACALLRVGLILQTYWTDVVAEATRNTYDYVIVGGGSAGSVLANRLSAKGDVSVLLLNIAGEPPKAYNSPVVISDEFIIHKNLSADDGLRASILQPGYSPKPTFSTAKTGSSPARWLGGSTLVGLTLYLRDHPEALNWGKGWNWTALEPYFHRAESLAKTCYGGNKSCGNYGVSGPYPISKEPAYTHPLTMDFIRAGRRAGFTETRELNTEHGSAVGVIPTSQYDDGSKANAFSSYLEPAMGRLNLHVQEGARADRLLMKDSRCIGVAYRDLSQQADAVVFARREVIISAGYVYTPRLLFLSGLAGKAELEKVGLPVVKDLPAVGKHLTSARYSPMAWHTEKPTLSQMVGTPISPPGAAVVPASYASTVQEAIARFRSETAKKEQPNQERSDIVLTFMPLFYAPASAPLQFSFQGEPWPLRTNAYTVLVTLGETEAKGSVSFESASPDVSPVITHEPLTKRDIKVAEEAVAKAKEVGASMGGAAVDNGAGAADMFSAIYDGRGTCRIGESSSDSVVDEELRVHGVGGLRIVDGSVIPHASPYLALPEVLALAERAAAMILSEGSSKVENAPSKRSKPVPHVTMPQVLEALGSHPTVMQVVEYLAGDSMKPPQKGANYFGDGEQQIIVLLMMSSALLGSLVTGFIIKKRCPPPQVENRVAETAEKSDAVLYSPLLGA
eukprot:TRINITY_DN106885_c0_g1_i1.p1 TRINITY_DN106885_c0_g1~~TRINITY_DN106885_c0_g1_i1.p1  ORF type:complete len:694 (-),score=109.61 TRINITY_DN106885_c0_g1_i1:28-2058(-)